MVFVFDVDLFVLCTTGVLIFHRCVVSVVCGQREL